MKTFGNLDKRQAGILMPVASLPSRHGIGDFGEQTRQFLKLSHKAGYRIWQILPLNPVGYGNSPYQPYSSFAGDEIYISLDGLVKDGLLKDVPSFQTMSQEIDYEAVREFKDVYFKKAYKNFVQNDDYLKFISEAFWLEDYATFMSLKSKNDFKAWSEWSLTKETIDQFEEKDYIKFLQYIFFKQWNDILEAAHECELMVIGDMPIYVGLDSADVYSHPEYFRLDKNKAPTVVAGVPPDYFSKDGQLWGNPLYDWDYLKETDYRFWIERLSWNQKLFDAMRIDHFRAFDTYWEIPADEDTARNGKWILGPSYDFFDSVFKQLPDLKLIAEDLGDLRPEVLELKDHYHMLGMRIMQYSFGPNEEKENFIIPEFCIAYSGTHDNSPVKGWYAELDKAEKRRMRRILNDLGLKGHDSAKKVYYRSMECDALICITPLQDLILIGGEGRINTPGTIGYPNWCWKLASLSAYEKELNNIKTLIHKTNRG